MKGAWQNRYKEIEPEGRKHTSGLGQAKWILGQIGNRQCENIVHDDPNSTKGRQCRNRATRPLCNRCEKNKWDSLMKNRAFRNKVAAYQFAHDQRVYSLNDPAVRGCGRGSGRWDQ